MRIFESLVAVVVAGSALALAGCSSEPTVQADRKQGVDVSTLGTYAWIEHEHPDEGTVVLLGADHAGVIRSATDAALTAKGYRQDANPAFLVNWHVAVQGRIDTARMAEYYGSGDGWRSWAAPTYPSASMPVSSDRNEEGTIVIDLLHAADRELFWRGFLTGVVDPSVGIQERRARIEMIVRLVVDQLPPAK